MKNQIKKIIFDISIYSVDAVLKASYKFTEELYFENIQQVEKGIEVQVKLKDTSKDLDLSILQFKNELIDQQLRHNLNIEFKSIREEIVKRAFSSIN